MKSTNSSWLIAFAFAAIAIPAMHAKSSFVPKFRGVQGGGGPPHVAGLQGGGGPPHVAGLQGGGGPPHVVA